MLSSPAATTSSSPLMTGHQEIWLKFKAKFSNDAEAQFQLGKQLLDLTSGQQAPGAMIISRGQLDSNIKRDIVKAINWIKSSAEQGHEEALNLLGEMLFTGQIPPKLQQGGCVKVLTTAAHRGSSPCSCRWVGSLFMEGRCGMIQDKEEAARWFNLSREMGNLEAETEWGLHHFSNIGDLEEAAASFQVSAGQGNAIGQYELARMYSDGKGGLVQDLSIAFCLFLASANQGYLVAQNEVADCYYLGKGVEKNLKSSFKWCLKSAEIHGDARGQFGVGKFYFRGEYVERNVGKAIDWWTLSGNQGNGKALYRLGLVYRDGDGLVIKDFKRAIGFLERSSITSCSRGEAQFALGAIYCQGSHNNNGDFDTDYHRARHWFKEASDLGFPGSDIKLHTIDLILNLQAGHINNNNNNNSSNNNEALIELIRQTKWAESP